MRHGSRLTATTLLAILLPLALAGCTTPEESVVVNDGGTLRCRDAMDWKRLVDFDVGHDALDVEYIVASNASLTVRILDPAGDTVHEKEDAQAEDRAVRRRFQDPADGLWLVETRCEGAAELAFAWTVVATGTK